jgi:hypothetical protein
MYYFEEIQSLKVKQINEYEGNNYNIVLFVAFSCTFSAAWTL